MDPNKEVTRACIAITSTAPEAVRQVGRWMSPALHTLQIDTRKRIAHARGRGIW
jgi:hypothetical protein